MDPTPPPAASGIVTLEPGDPAPWFRQRTGSRPRLSIDATAGRYIVLCFFATAGDPAGRGAWDEIHACRHHFDDARAACFGVSLDSADEAGGRVGDSIPGVRVFWDFDGTISRLYGAVPRDWRAGDGPDPVRRFWLVLDPTLRVMAKFPLGTTELTAYLDSLPPPDRFLGFPIQAPVLFVPNVFEPSLCRALIAIYETEGGDESGVMRDVGGRTLGFHDAAVKRRRDCTIADPDMMKRLRQCIIRRIIPEIWKIHRFNVTRMERYLIGCYAAEDAGHFRPHRDDTTKATAHRRFAVSVSLNDDFAGGELGFPEYGPRGYRMPPGGAVVFSGALMHAVSPVTRGRRYAFLPFLYDDAAAALRERNLT